MRCLVIEDDRALSAQLSEALSEAGFVIDRAHDGEQGEFLGTTESYDLCILDLGLPKLSGLDALRRWRAQGSTMPVLILTARGDWTDKVQGFRGGADDYVVKPFVMDEVVVRAQALVRRAAGHAHPVIRAGALTLDTQLGLVTRDGMRLKLTDFEHRILSYLIHHKGRVVSRTELSDHLYDAETDRDFKSLEVVIGRLRRKIGAAAIETVRGAGYRLTNDDTRGGTA